MTLDHLSFRAHDIAATRAFDEGQLGFPVLMHLRAPLASDRDPEQRQFPASLALFENASHPA